MGQGFLSCDLISLYRLNKDLIMVSGTGVVKTLAKFLALGS